VKRSKAVSLGLVPMVASWFTACGSPTPTHQQLCTDQQNKVIEDRYCVEQDDQLKGQGGGGSWNDQGQYQPRGGGGVVWMPYHWYYMPYRAGGYPLGYSAYDNTSRSGVGSFARPTAAGARVSTGRVATGGFGSTFHGSGGTGE
jgi:hypothetical protein